MSDPILLGSCKITVCGMIIIMIKKQRFCKLDKPDYFMPVVNNGVGNTR